ncbi:MAG: electron transfer flavoprotein subunit beta/FixA family protein [Acidobacteria bacterium]|nr:electron transfer flavoprotein subunit beta/FixA family protein [Acidobacteriota bacterium]
MNIVVCLKQVPSRESILRLDEAGRSIREGDLSYDLNEPDVFALEEALRLREKHGGEVVVCSLGPPRVQQVIKEAFAKGADRGLHLDDPSFDGVDPFQTAQALAGAIQGEKFDLILTGLQSEDQGFAQTGVMLAELLGIPHATIVMEIQVADDALSIKVKRELEGGWFQWVGMPLPGLLTIQSGINQPRYATLKGIMGAKKKEIRRVTAADLDLTASSPNRQRIERIFFPVKAKATVLIEGPPPEAAARLVEKLRNEAKVIR